MTTQRTSIFALFSACLALAPAAYGADGPASEAAIIKASKSHAGTAQATARFQKSQSHQAAESLIEALQSAESAPEEAPQRAARPDLFKAAPPLPQQTFTVQNELLRKPAVPAQISNRAANIAAQRAGSAASRALPTYNQ
jgi:hypothetical protein